MYTQHFRKVLRQGNTESPAVKKMLNVRWRMLQLQSSPKSALWLIIHFEHLIHQKHLFPYNIRPLVAPLSGPVGINKVKEKISGVMNILKENGGRGKSFHPSTFLYFPLRRSHLNILKGVPLFALSCIILRHYLGLNTAIKMPGKSLSLFHTDAQQ